LSSPQLPTAATTNTTAPTPSIAPTNTPTAQTNTTELTAPTNATATVSSIVPTTAGPTNTPTAQTNTTKLTAPTSATAPALSIAHTTAPPTNTPTTTAPPTNNPTTDTLLAAFSESEPIDFNPNAIDNTILEFSVAALASTDLVGDIMLLDDTEAEILHVPAQYPWYHSCVMTLASASSLPLYVLHAAVVLTALSCMILDTGANGNH
jgi:hypothetical protein